jgi:hypothetical protein
MAYACLTVRTTIRTERILRDFLLILLSHNDPVRVPMNEMSLAQEKLTFWQLNPLRKKA